MFENIFLENGGYREEKPKMKNNKKLQSSSHKWVLGEILQKLKGCLGKIRESSVYVYVCVMGYTCHEKKKVK